MNYEAVWKLMADLVADLRKSGESIPDEVMKDLRSAKIMIEVLKVDPTHYETLSRIEEYLTNVESYLVHAADKRFGEKCVDEWMSRVVAAKKVVQALEREPSKRFPVGVPRDKRWIRIKPSEELPVEKIKLLSDEIGLICKAQEDGYVLVYGEEDEVKRFVKKTAEVSHEVEH